MRMMLGLPVRNMGSPSVPIGYGVSIENPKVLIPIRAEFIALYQIRALRAHGMAWEDIALYFEHVTGRHTTGWGLSVVANQRLPSRLIFRSREYREQICASFPYWDGTEEEEWSQKQKEIRARYKKRKRGPRKRKKTTRIEHYRRRQKKVEARKRAYELRQQYARENSEGRGDLEPSDNGAPV